MIPATVGLSRPRDRFFARVQEAVSIERSGKDGLLMGKPDESQLAAMNKLAPKGVSYTADEMISIPWLASHSLMQYGNGCWSIDSLIQMAYGAPGKPMLLDHEYEIEESVGFIYQTHLVFVGGAIAQAESDPDMESIVWASAGDFYQNNADITARNSGVLLLLMETAHDANSPFVEGVKMGRIRNCSTGCYLFGEESYCCPICSDSYGEYVSFSDDRCPHLMPHPYLKYMVDMDNEEVKKLIAPYYIKHGVSDYTELSAVITPGLPGAKVL